MERGKFIVVEGINGCGKGEQLDLLFSYIRKSGKAVPIFVTGEPNYFDDNGRKAREMLARDGNPYENNLEAMRCFAQNRKTHNDIFVPLLEAGVDVILDRYWHSNFAFQHAQGIPYKDIASANRWLEVPDLTLILDVPVDVAFGRLHGRDGGDRRKFDSDRDFLGKVRANYLELPKVLPELMGDNSIVIIDGDCSVGEVRESVGSICDFAFNGP